MKNENYKIPLVIGVTGHRDILKKKILNDKIADIFDSLIKKYPNTPIILLTPLADGADRIVADVAFSEKYKTNITVSIPIPMDEKNYKDTFAKGIVEHKNADKEEKKRLEQHSADEYDKYIQKVQNQSNMYVPKIIPMLFDMELYNSLENIDENSIDESYYKEHFSNYLKLPKLFADFETDASKKKLTKSAYLRQQIRREQYTIVGEYISIHSNILLALYDDTEEEKPGGTKEIVRKKLTGDYDHFKTEDVDVTYPEEGIVYAISTPKGDKKTTTNYQINKLFPNGKSIKGLDKKIDKKNNIFNSLKDRLLMPCIPSNSRDFYNIYTLHNRSIECFNKNIDLYPDIKKINSKALKDISNLNVHDDNLIKRNIMIRRAASCLSRMYKNKMESIEKYILTLIFITVLLVVIKSDFLSFTYISFVNVSYIVLISLFYILYLKFKGYKEKTEDYRAISESIRVQIAWNMANINESTALYYLSHQKDSIGWIRTAMRGMKVFYIPKNKNDTYNIQQINEYWVDEQIEYFKDYKTYKVYEENINKKIKKYFSIFVFFTISFLILDLTTYIGKCSPIIWNLSIVDILKIVFIGIPAATTSYLKSKQLFDGNSDLFKEYKLSLDIFLRAKKLLSEEKKDKQQIYKSLGIEALRENSSWLISRREKDYEPLSP